MKDTAMFKRNGSGFLVDLILILGSALGFVLGLGVASAIATSVNFPLEELRYFATGFVGILGIVVAIRTYAHHVGQSISERSRRQTKSRINLAIELSNIAGYAERCMLCANAYRNRLQLEEFQSSLMSSDHADAPRLSDKTIERIAEAAADLEKDEIGDLLRSYQVQNARLAGAVAEFRMPKVRRTRLSDDQIKNCLRDAARLYLLAERQFETARGNWEFRAPSVTDNQIDECLRFRGFHH